MHYLLDYLANNATLITSTSTVSMQGKFVLYNYFLSIRSSFMPIATDKYYLLYKNSDFCVVACILKLSTPKILHHYTLCWSLQQELPLIMHVHFSPSNNFNIYPFTNSFLEQKDSSVKAKCISLTDTQNCIHFLNFNEIIYIESFHKDCIVNCIENSFHVHAPLSYFINNPDFSLLQVHRSFLVNCLHIRTMQHFSLTMSNNAQIPIPEKKYKAVKMMILENRLKAELQKN